MKNQDTTKTRFVLFVTLLLIICCGAEQALSEDAPAQANTNQSTPPDKQPADDEHLFEKCDYVLSAYVNDNGDVDYATLRRKRNDINDAVREIQDITPIQYLAWDSNHQKAFLINAHNIFTLKLIVDNYPIKPLWFMINYPSDSMKHIESGRARQKIFFNIIKHEYTLREIERDLLLGGFEENDDSEIDILIDKFDDLRVIFALTYASKSSAFLRNEAYRPDRLDTQLDEQVKKFLASDRGMVIDKQNNQVSLSGIFDWYKEYFLLSDYSRIKKFRQQPDNIRAYLNFIVRYVSPEDASYLSNADFDARRTVRYHWDLNDTANK